MQHNYIPSIRMPPLNMWAFPLWLVLQQEPEICSSHHDVFVLDADVPDIAAQSDDSSY